MTQRFLIRIEYDGTPFVGWQRQTNGISVQQVLEDAAQTLSGQPTLVQGAGRTDAGVHATGQVAHIELPDKFDANRVTEALNALVGEWPITVIKAVAVDAQTHARFSAIGRRYLYRILARRTPPALLKDRVWHHKHPLDAEAMQLAAEQLRSDLSEGQNHRIEGVPFFVLNGKLALSGAHPPEVLLNALDAAQRPL